MRVWPFRAAAVVALLQGLGHAALVLTARPHQPFQAEVVATMQAHAFDFSGQHRTYWDLYQGYALLAAGACLVEAVLLWLLVGLARAAPERLRGIVVVLVVANLAHLAMMLRSFFPLPAVFDGLIVLILLAALLPARRAA
jgi:hypothetical protein